VLVSEQGFEVRSGIHAFDRVSHALEAKGIRPASAEIAHIPTSTVPVRDAQHAEALERLHDDLDELDDVQQVFSNEDAGD
jgi:transcriptional/translational regulatory protein YebC/TACO1